MLKQIEGSMAIAEAVALCRPEVICAYPITPQTHIVEGIGGLVKSGKLQNCEFINVESEFAALSVAIGSSADEPIATDSAANSDSTLMNSQFCSLPLFTSPPMPSTICVCGVIG